MDHKDRVRQDVSDIHNDIRKTRDDATKAYLDHKEDHQSMGEYMDDAGITAKVKAKFLGQKGLDSMSIKVTTVDGVVTLMGDVKDSGQISMAESVARQVKGVKSVDNKLVLEV